MSPPLLANAVFGIVAAAKPVAVPILPTSAELDAQLGTTSATWSTLLTRVLDSYVDPLYTGLPATPVAGAPGVPPAAWNTEAQIRKVMSSQASVVFVPPVSNTLPLSKADVLDFKLGTFQPGTNDILNALDTYLDYIASGRSLAPTLISSKVVAARAVRELGTLEAFLIRFDAALRASAAAGISLAETLAMYRVEGNLTAPLSAVHLSDRLPINEQLTVRNLGVDTGNVELTLKRALWSYPFQTLAPRALGIIAPASLPAVGAARDTAEKRAKSFALLHWMLVIGGLDFLAGFVAPPMDALVFRDIVTTFMSMTRAALGLPAAVPAMQAEFDAVFADLSCTWPADKKGRVVVAPNTPTRLAGFCLTQAMIFSRLNHVQGAGPFVEPHPDLKYLAYNLQHSRSATVQGSDRFIHLLASASVAAAKSVNPAFGTLKGKLLPLGLPVKLVKDPFDDPTDHLDVFDKLTKAPIKFLDDATNSALLAEFVLRAEDADWRAFEENRGNLARYRKLLAYYTALLG
jgi:hypothetical protein